jgi:hypothetical protein
MTQDRRQQIADYIKEQNYPVTGSTLSQIFNVSRQIIVSDIAALKHDHPIVSTKRGYIYQPPQKIGGPYERTVMVSHTAEEMSTEVRIIVENGAIVNDVSIQHPIYGRITVELMLTSIEDCDKFSRNMLEDNGRMLAELTDGIHQHTLSAVTEKILDNAVNDLRKHGFLLEQDQDPVQ